MQKNIRPSASAGNSKVINFAGEFLTFMSGTEEYGLDILKVQEISEVPSLVTSIDTKYIVSLATKASKMLILIDIEQLMSSQEVELLDDVAIR